MNELTCPVCGDAIDSEERTFTACTTCGAHFLTDANGALLTDEEGKLLYRSPYASRDDDSRDQRS